MTQTALHWLAEQGRQHRAVLLIFDRLAEPELPARLPAASALPTCINLYQGSPAAPLAELGPWLVGVPDAQAPWLQAWLEQPEHHWGWLASVDRFDLPQLLRHWHERTLIEERGRRILYRYQDNRVIARHLHALEAEQRPLLLGPLASCLAWDGQAWQSFDNPAPGLYPVPPDAPWLNVPEPAPIALAIRRRNLEQWLWQNHCAALCRLLEEQEFAPWLEHQLTQASAWGWHADDSVKFLLAHQLHPEQSKHPAWTPLAGESPEAHLARCRQTFQETHA
jgi:hypothetical protein